MADQQRRRPITSRIDIGIGLISFTLLLSAATALAARMAADALGLGIGLLIAAAGLALIAVLWISAIRNSRAERAARQRLLEQHPGALVERIRLWTLPHGRVEPHLPTHFIIADAREITFETIDQTVLLRIPVERLGFVDPVRAQNDRAKDTALTLIYDGEGDEQLTVQFFTVTGVGLAKLRARVRTAIGWPADGTR